MIADTAQLPRTHGWSIEQRIALRTVVDLETGCHRWIGGLCDGYGVVGFDGTSRRVHRLVWTMANGPIPAGLVLDHRCHTLACEGGPTCPHRACHNLAHLQLLTNRENLLRGQGFAGRQARQTHCLRGHEFTSANTYVIPTTGGRQCRACVHMLRRRKAVIYQ